MTARSTLAILLMLAGAPRAQSPPAPAGGQPCPVAEDSGYAYTVDQPVQVGGSPVYGAARQRRYVEALRGPEGQRIEYKRQGQAKGPDGTILDVYEVSYEGLPKPVTLYLDWYHYNPPKAPKGFTCGQPFNLGPPPVSPFQEMQDLYEVAIADGAGRDVDPIPLGADGSPAHGVVFDRFRLLARASRTAASEGRALDPRNPPRELARQGMVIVAYPQPCGERLVSPAAIDIVAPNGAVMPRGSDAPATGDTIAQLVPGFEAPAGSIAIPVRLPMPRPNDTVRITYEEPCGTTGDQVNLRITGAPARGIDMPEPALPPGAPADQPVLLQVLVDLDGRMRNASYVGGPVALAQPAIDAVGGWRSEPARINGAPVATAVLVQVRFRP